MTGRSSRTALALAAFGLVAVVSYTLQRLWAAWQGELSFAANVSTVYIPYFWRCDLSALHGLGASVLVAFGLDEVRCQRALVHLPWIVLAVVLPSALAMALVP